MTEAKVTVKDLDAIATTVKPGEIPVQAEFSAKF